MASSRMALSRYSGVNVRLNADKEDALVYMPIYPTPSSYVVFWAVYLTLVPKMLPETAKRTQPITSLLQQGVWIVFQPVMGTIG